MSSVDQNTIDRYAKLIAELERQLAEAQGKLKTVEALDFDHNHNTRVFIPHCPRCQLDRILSKEGE